MNDQYLEADLRRLCSEDPAEVRAAAEALRRARPTFPPRGRARNAQDQVQVTKRTGYTVERSRVRGLREATLTVVTALMPIGPQTARRERMRSRTLQFPSARSRRAPRRSSAARSGGSRHCRSSSRGGDSGDSSDPDPPGITSPPAGRGEADKVCHFADCDQRHRRRSAFCSERCRKREERDRKAAIATFTEPELARPRDPSDFDDDTVDPEVQVVFSLETEGRHIRNHRRKHRRWQTDAGLVVPA